MQRYCNGRARTPADYAEFYTIATKDLTRSLQHLGQVALRLTPDCNADCLAQLKAELGNNEGKALQQVLMLAGEKHAGSGLGIFAGSDL